MSEIFDTINAKADAASAAAPDADLLATWQKEEAKRKKAARRRADVALALRWTLFGFAVAGVAGALQAGLIASELVWWLLLAGFTYMGAYTGAWLQYRFGKDGVWKWN